LIGSLDEELPSHPLAFYIYLCGPFLLGEWPLDEDVLVQPIMKEILNNF